MIATSTTTTTVNNRNGVMNVRYEHRVDISSKNYTTETETYAIIRETEGYEGIELDRKQMRDLFGILWGMKDKGQL